MLRFASLLNVLKAFLKYVYFLVPAGKIVRGMTAGVRLFASKLAWNHSWSSEAPSTNLLLPVHKLRTLYSLNLKVLVLYLQG